MIIPAVGPEAGAHLARPADPAGLPPAADPGCPPRDETLATTLPPLAAWPRPTLPPLSFAQERLWLLDRLAPGSPAHVVAAAFELRGAASPAALTAALTAVARRHEALRTRFVTLAGEPRQEIQPPRPVPLPLIDLSGLCRQPAAAPAPAAGNGPCAQPATPPPVAGELARLAREEAGRPFDLAAGRLLRASLVRLGGGEPARPLGVRAAGGSHVLLLTLHQLVYDAGSERVLLDELSALHDGVAELPGLPVQYADFAAWQRAWPPAVLAGQLDYWRRQLAGAPAALELPADRPRRSRPAAASWRSGRRELRLPATAAACLRQAARREGATLHMLLLAGFTALLARYTGQDELLLGTAVANRMPPQVEGLIGRFANTLALRVRLPAAADLRGLLAAVRATALAAFARQDLPFAAVVEDLGAPHDPPRPPLVQVMLALTSQAAGRSRTGLRFRRLPIAGATAARLDLSLSAAEVEDDGGQQALDLALDYAADLFNAATAARLLAHYAALLQGAAALPELALWRLPLLSAAESHQLLAEWNDTAGHAAARGAAGGRWVHELVAERALRTPAAAAVIDGERQVSYGELELWTCAVAGALRGLGVGPEVRVGVCLPRSPELVAAVLAVLRAGGAYVALDPSHPEERLSFQLADSRVPVLLTRDRRLAATAAARGIRCLAPDHQPAAGCATHLPAPRLHAANLAYVIYTSGSTGRPKAVELSHGALLNLVGWHRRAFAVTAADRAALVAGVGFDASVWETWPYLAAGASLHVVPEACRTAPERLHDWMLEQAVTIGFLPVPLAEAVLDLRWEPAGGGRPAARCLLTGGDRLHRYPPAALPFPLINAYGPTEGTVVATAGRVPATGPPDDHRAPTLGRPIDGVRLHVVGLGPGAMQPVPAGVPGELLIGGPGLARGYLGRPELTAERFVPDPFAGGTSLTPAAGERLYRSGDLVRWLPDGEVEFLGRIDHQVKIRGHRIELGEIEAVLALHPAVREVVVLAAGGSLVAFYSPRAAPVPESVPEPEPAALREHARHRLPEAMIPALFVQLAALPLGSSGKVDRQALARLGEQAAAAQPAGAAAPAAFHSPAEELVAGVWEEVLGRSPIGRDDDFFLLGGHSLLVTRVLSRLDAALGVQLPLKTLFELPTVSALAAAATAARQPGRQILLPPLARAPRQALPPASFAQQRLWFLDRLAPGSRMYNIGSAFALRGQVAPAALAAALTEMVRRHEALRTRFVEVDGEPRQEIQPPHPVRLPLIDLGGLRRSGLAPGAAGPALAELDRLGQEAADRVFDLARGPLLRAALIRLGGGGPGSALATAPAPAGAGDVLLLTLHHIVYDGWSEGVLLGELPALYATALERAAGAPVAALPALPVQYADFAAWQRAWPPAVLAGQLDHWRRQLAGAPQTIALPIDLPRPPRQSFRGATRALRLPAAAAARLREAARRQGATLYMLLLAGFAALLARYTGQEDMLIGTPVANRMRPEVERLIGFFVNTLALRVRLAGDPQLRELLATARDAALAAFANQDLPFEALVDELRPQRNLARNPLIQVLLSLQSAGRALGRHGADADADAEQALRLTPLRLGERTTAKLELSLVVDEVDDAAGAPALALELEYATDLFTAATATRLLAHYAALLDGAAAAPELPLSRLPLLSAAERHQLLAEWNDTASAFPRATLHRLFEQQAAARPEAVAVVWEQGALSYGELDRRAGAIARRLRRLGIGPEARVGLCVERSGAMVAAVLGILKAGGAYVPLDPSYPRRRLELLLAGAAPAALVGSRRLLAALPGATPRLALEEVAAPEEPVKLGALETLAELAAPATPCGDGGEDGDGRGEAAPRGTPADRRRARGDGAVQPVASSGRDEQAEGLAYVLYTSGSTGTPKGVAVSHRAVVRLVRDTGYAAFGPEEVFLQLAPMSFDAATFELWGPLLNGGRLALFPPRPFSLAELNEAVARHGVTTLWLTAGLFHLAVEEGLEGLRGLRQLLAGGDVLSPAHVERALAALPAVELINGYGPTENTTFSSCQRLRRRPGAAARQPQAAACILETVSIGRPIAGSQAYVLDRDLQPLPVGCAGELFVGGAGVARCYVGDPGPTAASFVPDPFDGRGDAIRGGARLYRTGDLARWRPDGRLEFMGRRDLQVKVRGFRIEPGEVESVLLRHPGVREAVVVALREGARDHRLCAYFVAAAGLPAGAATGGEHDGAAGADAAAGDISPGDDAAAAGGAAQAQAGRMTAGALRAYLRERLPEHMVPSAFVQLAALPLDPNGKVDRRALPAPERAAVDDPAGAVASLPHTQIEEVIAGIWEEVLGIAPALPPAAGGTTTNGGANAPGGDGASKPTAAGARRLGMHDNFFEIGGHSLQVTRVLSRIHRALKVNLPVQALFEHPTVSALARLVAAARQDDMEVALPPLAPAAHGSERQALSFAQQRLWFLDRLTPGSSTYNIPAAFDLDGAVEPAALAAALGEIARRHEVLRTRFVEAGGKARQEIQPPQPVPLPSIDLSALPREQPAHPSSPLPDRRRLQAAELERLTRQEALRPFDLARGPLLRAALVRLGGGEPGGQLTPPDRHGRQRLPATPNHETGRDVLLLTVHHIASDAWSDSLLLGELSVLYAAARARRPSPLRELAIQYADFAAWQRAWPPAVMAGQLAYWRGQLAGASMLLPPLGDRPPRPQSAAQSPRGGNRELGVPAAVTAGLRRAARREGTTLYMLLLAGFAALLARHSGREDLLIGTPVANRTQPEIEELIGFFVNMLVMRVQARGDPQLRQLLAAVRETALGALAHQDLPFEALVEELRPERDQGRSTLIQAVLALQSAQRPAPGAGPGAGAGTAGAGLCCKRLPSAGLTTAKFDLSMSVSEIADGGGAPALALHLEYAADLFTVAAAARLLEHYAALLAGIAAAAPEVPLSALPLLAAAERHQLLAEWSDSARAYPRAPLVHEMFAAHARLRPQAVAVAARTARLTYGELERRANRLAQHLRRRGIGPEALVAVCTDRTLDRVVGIVAVLKAGGAYVSLDPAYPAERLSFLLHDSGAQVVLTEDRFAARLPATGAEVIRLDAGWDRVHGDEWAAPVTAVGPQNLAYVVYTSGSTGQPKGVAIPHAGLLNLVHWYQECYGLQPGDRGTQIASPAFDASVVELWPFLAGGGELHIPDEATRLSATAMLRWWSEVGITLAYLMTPLAEVVMEELQANPTLGRGLPVRSLFSGGDRLHHRPAPGIGFRLWNTYGPAEYSVTTSAVAVEPPAPAVPAGVTADGGTLPSIGRPLPNTRIYVLDPGQQLLPVGVPGELYVAGVGLARGYLGRPQLTAEKFVPDPWGGEPGARMYRTADLVRYLPDGDIDFLGRVDHQVKLRGYRIELGEIENVLARHPAVREAVVVMREDRPGAKRLIGYVVAAAEPGPESEDLRAFLQELLPEYMVPRIYVRLDALPLTANGKVDRRALPEVVEEREAAPPETETEALLVEIWQQLLGRQQIGIYDNLFDLGAHSLLAPQFSARVEEVFGLDLPLHVLFESPTIRELAVVIQGSLLTLIESLSDEEAATLAG